LLLLLLLLLLGCEGVMMLCLLSRSVNNFAAGSASRRPQFDDRPDFLRGARLAIYTAHQGLA